MFKNIKLMFKEIQKLENKEQYKMFLSLCRIPYTDKNGKLIVHMEMVFVD